MPCVMCLAGGQKDVSKSGFRMVKCFWQGLQRATMPNKWVMILFNVIPKVTRSISTQSPIDLRSQLLFT